MEALDNFLGRLKRVVRRGRGWKASCPCHDDPNQSLSITVGYTGGVVYYCHAGCDRKQVLAKMGLVFKDLYSSGGRGKMTQQKTRRYVTDLKTLDDVYNSILLSIHLSSEHAGELAARWLNSSDIFSNDYRSLFEPVRLGDSLYQKYGHDLLDIPGVFRGPDSCPWFKGPPGMVIPILSSDGFIRCLQIRTGNSDRKYWLPEGSGSPVHVPVSTWPTGALSTGTVWVTEGPLKADVVAALNHQIPVVAVISVSTWRSILPALKQWGVKRVVTAFDQDWVSKKTVLGQLEQFEQALEHGGYEVHRAGWYAIHKGLDDALLAGSCVFTTNRSTGETCDVVKPTRS